MTGSASPTVGWKARISTTIDRVPALEDAIETAFGETAFGENGVTIVSFEEDEDRGTWTIEVYWDGEQDPAQLKDQLLGMARTTGLAASDFQFHPLDRDWQERDWVSESQKILQPIRAGRYFVHGSHARDAIPAGVHSIEIDAGQAFGTGSHETTRACLLAIDRLARSFHPKNMLDVGTGSGILALAAWRAWPGPVMATDIDPIAVRVARLNAIINKTPVSPLAPQDRAVRFDVAAGLNTPLIRDAAPFDLIIANILMKPLCVLAPDIVASLGTQGKVILSGLLSTQAPAVFAAYRNRGLKLQERIVLGNWTTLVLTR
mgnify:CR=1 FL=1